MKALHLIPYMHPSAGGPPVVADRFCRHLIPHGWEVEVITTDNYAREDDSSWIEDYQAPYKLTVLPSRGKKGFGFSSSLKRELRAKLPTTDIVHIHNLWSYFNIQGSRLCRKLSIPFVVSTHGMLDPHSLARKSWKKRAYGNWIEWPQLRSATGMIYTHSEEQRLAEQQCSGLPEGHVIPLAADDPPSKDRQALSRTFLAEHPQFTDKTRLLFLGRLHSKKGLDLLIPAMARIRDANPNVVLIFVGPCEPDYRIELDRMLARNGVAQACHFVGPLSGERKWSALAAADLFMLPSYQENFAIALVEALRVGTPALISKRVNIWQALESNRAAFVADLTVDSVVEKTLESLSDRTRLQGMSDAALKYSATSYSWQASTRLLDQDYRKLLAVTRNSK